MQHMVDYRHLPTGSPSSLFPPSFQLHPHYSPLLTLTSLRPLPCPPATPPFLLRARPPRFPLLLHPPSTARLGSRAWMFLPVGNTPGCTHSPDLPPFPSLPHPSHSFFPLPPPLSPSTAHLGVQGVDVLAGGQHARVTDGVTTGARLHVLAVQGLSQGAQLVVLDHLSVDKAGGAEQKGDVKRRLSNAA